MKLSTKLLVSETSKFLLLFLAALFFNYQTASAQQFDTSFLPKVLGEFTVSATGVQADGKILLAGNFIEADGQRVSNLIRINADGTWDETFSSGTGTTFPASTIVQQADGKILVAGFFEQYNDTAVDDIIRLNEDGSIDETFSYTEKGRFNNVTNVLVQPDGKILIRGVFYIDRLNTDGSFDTSFTSPTMSNDGFSSAAVIPSMALQTDGKIVIGGQFQTINDVRKESFARLNADGSLDEEFGTGAGADGIVNAIAIQPDGNIIIGGFFDEVNGVESKRVARLTADGDLDQSFTSSFLFNSNPVNAIRLLANGQILLGGRFSNPAVSLFKINSDGSRDDTFVDGFQNERFQSEITTIQLMGDQVLIGGQFSRYNDDNIQGLAVIDIDGNLSADLNANLGGPASINTMALLSDNSLLIAGNMVSVDGTLQQGIAKIKADGSLDADFTSGSEYSNAEILRIVEQPDGKIILGGSFSSYHDKFVAGIVRVNADGSLDETFDTRLTRSFSSDGVYDLFLQDDGKVIIGGAFSSVNSIAKNNFARLNSDGTLDESFNPNDEFQSRIWSILPLADGQFVVGGHDPNEDGHITIATAIGEATDQFNSGNNVLPRIREISLAAEDTLLVESSTSLEKYLLDGTKDFSFGPEGFSYSSDYIQLGNQYLGANDFLFNDPRRIIRFNADGIQEDSFHWNIENGIVRRFLETDDFLYVSGSFYTVDGQPVYGLLKTTVDFLNPPSELQVESGEQITLSWKDNAANETGYEIHRASIPLFDRLNNAAFSLYETLDANSTSFTDDNVDEANRFLYKVRAKGADQNSVFSNIVFTPVLDLIPPSEIMITNVNSTTARLSWSPVPRVFSNYEILREQEGAADVRILLSSDETSYEDTAIEQGIVYNYSIRTINRSVASEFSDKRSFSSFPAGIARSAAVNFTLGDQHYFGLGAGQDTTFGDFFNINLQSQVLTPIAQFPGVARESAVAFEIDGFGYVGTGLDKDDNYLSDFYRYDPTNNEWTAIASIPVARRSAVAFVLDGEGYVGTGRGETDELADFWKYSPATNSWTEVPGFSGSKRQQAVAFAIAGKAYVATGVLFDGFTEQLSDVQEYDPATGTWTETVFADINLNFTSATAFTLFGQAYIAYGNQDQITRYDPVTNQIENLGDVFGLGTDELGPTRSEALAFVTENEAYFGFGRSGFFTTIYYADLFRFALPNEAPTDILLSNNVVIENTGTTVVGTLTSVDANDNRTPTFSLAIGNGSNDRDNDAFTISDDQLSLKELPDFEITNQYRINIRVSDASGAEFTKSFQINIEDANDPPVLTLEDFEVDENSAQGTVVGTVAVSDQDGDDVTLAIDSGNSGNAFAFDGFNLIVNNSDALNFEETAGFELMISVQDATDSDSGTLNVSVNNLNEAPVVDELTFNIPENSANGTIVGQIIATDPENDPLTVNIFDGTGAGIFELNGNNELIVINSEQLDFEVNPTFELIINVADGNVGVDATFTINLSNVNEAPSLVNFTTPLPSNSENGAKITDIPAIDPEGDALNFEVISGNDEDFFSVTDGALFVNDIDAVIQSGETQFVLEITVSDMEFSATASVTIELVEVTSSDANLQPIGIYPNPADQWLTLELHGRAAQAVEVTILDISGHVIARQATLNQIDVSTLPGGVYIARIALEAEVATLTFVKK